MNIPHKAVGRQELESWSKAAQDRRAADHFSTPPNSAYSGQNPQATTLKIQEIVFPTS